MNSYLGVSCCLVTWFEFWSVLLPWLVLFLSINQNQNLIQFLFYLAASHRVRILSLAKCRNSESVCKILLISTNFKFEGLQRFTMFILNLCVPRCLVAKCLTCSLATKIGRLCHYIAYSRVRNKHTPTFIILWNFFHGLTVLLRT